jgi:hypothetical protein
MTNTRRREPAPDVPAHAAPRQAVTLAATAQDCPPGKAARFRQSAEVRGSEPASACQNNNQQPPSRNEWQPYPPIRFTLTAPIQHVENSKTTVRTPGMQRSRVDRNCRIAAKRTWTFATVLPCALPILSRKYNRRAASPTTTSNPISHMRSDEIIVGTPVCHN